jgi:hypothetical protein
VLNHDEKEITMTGKPATPKQLSYIRKLANDTGTSFTPPRTSSAASREIERLKSIASKSRVQDTDFATPDHRQAPYGTAQQDGEVYGYGSTASWQRPLRNAGF